MTETDGGSSYGSGPGGPGGPDEPADSGRNATTKEWLGQLQSMIDNVATHAGPVMRDIAAKAAELAATAGEKAGPFAHKAAEVTESAGAKLAVRGREVAAELRRDGNGETAAGAGAATGDRPNTIQPGPGASTTPPSPRPGQAPDSADSLGE
jgi:hypothetical protein